MNAEFNWWLLIVGLVIGGALVYLVLADFRRVEADVAAEEVPLEATWIATVLRREGVKIDAPTAERVLELHRAYLASPPPDDEVEVDAPVTEAPVSTPPPRPRERETGSE